ncbi:YbfB/YjiJ family MFS transporter [Vreelandella profundi]|uniref:YbfB/YjiJ family MFS transporter n=1 Tax=Vreelandella profundi TaxID=2852117 RepID=UPI002356EA19|nr:YbfB/YjiJ family MFS transporter [Halomonas profundi]
MINRKDWPALMIGVMATLAGIGIARFAYTPLLPAIIQEGWFTASQGAYLGAANLLGYFIGALCAHALSERFSSRLVIGASFAAIALSFMLCAGAGSFFWFFLWRLVSGIAGAILMVVGPSLALRWRFRQHRLKGEPVWGPWCLPALAWAHCFQPPSCPYFLS